MTQAPRSLAHPQTASDGFIVVAVLWILAALAALVSIYAIYISNSAIALSANGDTVVAQGLVSAGVELAAYQILSAPKEERPTRGEFSFRLGKARVAVDYRGETARIDLNRAPKELLAGLFVALGARPEQAAQYVERIIGWRTKPSADDREATLYRDARLSYGPRGAPFAHVAELWLVLGLPPTLVERSLPHLTVFSGQPEVNIRNAAPEVIAAVPGLPAGARNAGLGPSPGTTATTGGPAAPAGTTTEGGDAVRVTVRVDLDNGRRRTAEAVILVRDFGDDPFRVLSWQDDIDAQLPEPRQPTRSRR